MMFIFNYRKKTLISVHLTFTYFKQEMKVIFFLFFNFGVLSWDLAKLSLFFIAHFSNRVLQSALHDENMKQQT